jgi:hypothetical protein
VRVLVALALAAATVAAQGQSRLLPIADAGQILAASREALGGQQRIDGVKTVVMTGRTRQLRGNNLVPIEFEIQIALPDKYARTDEFPAQDAGPATSGFSGNQLIQIPALPPPVGRPGGPPPPTAAQRDAVRAIGLKQDFARLMLGMFASSYDAFPLTFTFVAQAEAPQGKADVIEAKGPANFTARLFISADTHLPILVSWGPPQGPEQRMYFGDYRDVNGLKLPFRLRRATGADTTEETTFDRFRTNAKVDDKKFEVPR